MKTQTFFLTRWWNEQSLQARLFLVFTLLFAFSVLTLSFFLLNVSQMIYLNHTAQITFEENRKIYQLKTLLKQYDLNLKQYEVSSSPTAEQELSIFGERIDGQAAALRTELAEDDLDTLNRFVENKTRLTPLFTQVIQAVDAEDWEKVQELDGQVEKLLDSLYQEIDLISSHGVDELDFIKLEADVFNILAFATGTLSVPMFIILSTLTMTIIYIQINLPVEQLARAAKDLQQGEFQPNQLGNLTKRKDEIGTLSREFIVMATAVTERTAKLQQEAKEIRAKIR